MSSPIAFRLVFLSASLALGACANQGTSKPQPPAQNPESSYSRLMKLAGDVAQRGDHGTAATLYQRATQDPGAGVEAWTRLGELKLESGDDAAAEHAFQQALALDPSSAPIKLGLGTAQLRLGHAERAEPLLSEAADSLDSVIAYTRLGVAQSLLGNTAAAQDAFANAMSLAPNDLDSRCNLALAYALNNQPGLALAEIEGADKAPTAQARHQRNALLIHVLVGSKGKPDKVRLDGVSAKQRKALMIEARRITAIKDPAEKAQALGLIDKR